MATFPEEGSDAESLLRYAEEAMYAAKQKGKNHSRFRANSSVER